MPDPGNSACVYNVPMAIGGSPASTVGLEPEDAMARNLQHVAASRSVIVGPMPVQSFLDTFLPVPQSSDRSTMQSSIEAFESVPLCADSRSEISRPLVAALNENASHESRCPGFVFEKVASRSLHPRRLGYMKPDICCFTHDSASIVESADYASRTELGYAELFFKVEADPALDIFTDPPQGASPDIRAAWCLSQEYDDEDENFVVAQRATKMFGQHVAFATEIFARQYRVFLFSVSVAGSRARLLRWDRSGCVITESFDIREQPDPLCDFLWRFSNASHAGRGHDMSVEAASVDEEIMFRTLITEETRLQTGLEGYELDQAVLHHYRPGHATAMHVLPEGGSRDNQTVHRFIVSRPVVSPLSLAGKGTRGFWAVDTTSRSVVFLKDTWRSPRNLEGDVLQHLNTAEVRNVPTAVAHGDVPASMPSEAQESSPHDYQVTYTDQLHSASWRCRVYPTVDIHVSPRRHYRLVTGPVGYDLRFVQSTEELLHATYDILVAMRDALYKGSRLHRDISIGNIVLVREQGRTIRRGYLIDWESSSKTDDSGEANDSRRVGTWEFMSIKMLRARPGTRRMTIRDDMESLLYVVLYAALLWLPHNYSKDKLTNLLDTFFSQTIINDGDVLGGDEKLGNSIDRMCTDAIQFGSDAFRVWLDTVLDMHSPLSDVESQPEDHEKWTDTRPMERDDRVYHEVRRPYLPGDSSSSGSDDSSDTDTESAAFELNSDQESFLAYLVDVGLLVYRHDVPERRPVLRKRAFQEILDTESPQGPASKRPRTHY